MTRGDLVHVPQSAFLILGKNDTTDTEYLKAEKPLKAIFWEKDIKEPYWSFVYYRNQIWSVRTKDIYPITQEVENAC